MPFSICIENELIQYLLSMITMMITIMILNLIMTMPLMIKCTFSMTILSLHWRYFIPFQVYPDVSTLFLGMTASSYNVGHFLFAFLFGIWAERRNAKEPLVFALCTIVSGCIIYAYAENVSGYMGTCMILIARTVVGMVAGNTIQ